MHSWRQSSALALIWFLALPPAGLLEARSRKGDRSLEQARAAERRGDFDKALELYEQALAADPTDQSYQLGTRRVRFQAGQKNVDRGQKLRSEGKLEEALAAFEKAYAIDPASSIAEQEIQRTRQMIERAKGGKDEAELKPEDRGLTPSQLAKKKTEETGGLMQPLPELRPLSTAPITALRMNNQPPKVLYETVAKLAGVNVIFDPDYATSGGKNASVELSNVTLEEALDHLSILTRSFWKPLSANTIFVTQDNTAKRNDYEDQVMKVFYLTNITTAQELQELSTTIRSITELRRVFTYGAQNAIIVRGEADRVALAEKLLGDLDKAKPEVLVDVIVLEANRSRSRDLTTGIAPKGITSPISFTPRAGITSPSTGSGSGSGSSTGTGTTTTTTTTTAGAANSAIPLTNLSRISTRDFSTVIPGGNLNAVMSNSDTKVLQSPQIRAADGQKASLRIGDKVPTASGSFQPGFGGVGINPLVNTQFQFIDVGVNVDITPKIHGSDEVSLHVEVEISTVRDRINLGGIEQPIIGQRKVVHDIRMKEGEANVLSGLLQSQSTKTMTGVPFIGSIPIIGRLFSGESIQKSDSELLIVLVPHIIRTPEITDLNLKGIAVGNQTVVKLNYAPRRQQPAASASEAPASAPAAPPAALPAAPPAPISQTAPAAPPKAPVKAAFVPGRVDGVVNSQILVNLSLDTVDDLFAAPLRLQFDPKILQLTDIRPGQLLSGDGKPVLTPRNILNDAGEATVNLSRMPGSTGVSGAGTLVTLVFQTIGSGASTVTVKDFKLSDSKGQPIPVTDAALAVTVK